MRLFIFSEALPQIYLNRGNLYLNELAHYNALQAIDVE